MSQVLVADRAAFFGGAWPQGFVALPGPEGDQFLTTALAASRFVDRPIAEQTPAWKQWIPYCLLCCRGGDGSEPGVLLVRRTKGQSEARLHGAWSIGLGGHVDPEDGPPSGPGNAYFARALGRELTEELVLPSHGAPKPRFLGLLNDDSTDVGAVHAGLVYRVDLDVPNSLARKQISIREVGKMEGCFTHLVEFFKVWQDGAPFESWSSVLVRAGCVDAVGVPR